MDDEYLTITTTGEGLYSEKRSKFLAFAHHVDSVEEAMEWVGKYRKKYFDARHVCYAYMIGADGTTYRANDDGEPSSTAGKPILGQIQSHGLTNVVVVVVRYYGGVNLGTGGLIVAYRSAACEALDSAKKEKRLVEETVSVEFPYPAMNGVMRVVKEMQPRVVSQTFDNTCSMTLAIRHSQAAALRKRLEDTLR